MYSLRYKVVIHMGFLRGKMRHRDTTGLRFTVVQICMLYNRGFLCYKSVAKLFPTVLITHCVCLQCRW